jgi:hypothetical protein
MTAQPILPEGWRFRTEIQRTGLFSGHRTMLVLQREVSVMSALGPWPSSETYWVDAKTPDMHDFFAALAAEKFAPKPSVETQS